MMEHYPRSRFLILLLILMAGCVNPGAMPASTVGFAPAPAPSAVPTDLFIRLPNLLVQATGLVEIRRTGTVTLLPATVGTYLSPGDLLVLKDGEAAIFCGDESTWDSSPIPLMMGERYGVPCGVGAPPRAAPDIASVRARSGDADSTQSELRVVSPRSGNVANQRPTFVWTEISGATTYTVTLSGDDGHNRPPAITQQAILAYPAEWEPLQEEASYRLTVESAGNVTDAATPGFTYLAQEVQQTLFKHESRLRQRPFDEVGLTLLLAHLYLSHDLRSEGVDLLNALPNASEIVAVQHLLGDTYLEMGLLLEAQSAYANMEQLAQSNDLVEAEAAAQMGSGHVACVRLEPEVAKTAWQQARVLYAQINQDDQTMELDALLVGLTANCQ